MNIKKGFTFAEILVALAIISVVASFTVPTVVANYKKNTNTLLLKKTYMELEQTLSLFSTKYYRGLYFSPLAKDTNAVKQFFLDYYSLDDSNICETAPQPCFGKTYVSMTGVPEDFTCEGGISAKLKSGVAMCIGPADSSSGTPAWVTVDVNGDKKPNIGGRDIFTFQIFNDYTIDDIPTEYATHQDGLAYREQLFTEGCQTSSIGIYCLSKILADNWKMKY